jgi:transcription elongation factor Elf1
MRTNFVPGSIASRTCGACGNSFHISVESQGALALSFTYLDGASGCALCGNDVCSECHINFKERNGTVGENNHNENVQQTFIYRVRSELPMGTIGDVIVPTIDMTDTQILDEIAPQFGSYTPNRDAYVLPKYDSSFGYVIGCRCVE